MQSQQNIKWTRITYRQPCFTKLPRKQSCVCDYIQGTPDLRRQRPSFTWPRQPHIRPWRLLDMLRQTCEGHESDFYARTNLLENYVRFTTPLVEHESSVGRKSCLKNMDHLFEENELSVRRKWIICWKINPVV